MPNKTWWVFTAFLGLLVVFYLQYLQIGRLRDQVTGYKSQLATLVDESRSQADRYEEARKRAEIAMKQSQINAKEVMLAQVSPKCRLAIKWGVQQAKVFKG